jgi:predicted RecB family endonuclease
LNGDALTNERWLKWAIGRYYRSLGYKVSMKPARAGNAMVDGVAVTPEGERIAIEVKSPRDDIIRGVGQCYEAVCAGYTRAVLVTTLRVGKKLRRRVFQRKSVRLVGVDAKARIHRYDADGWRLLG